jgi:AraC family ethanolamine operon transcriptional activator
VPALEGAHISRSVVSESEAYTEAVAGVVVDTVRLGEGLGPSVIRTAVEQRFIATSGTAGMPLAHHSTIPDDVVVVAHIARASPGSSWCGIDLEPGTAIVYSPSADHAGVDQSGLEFTFVATSVDQIGELADRLHLDLPRPERGMVRAAPRGAQAVDRTFRALAGTMRNHDHADSRLGTDVLCAMVEMLAAPSQALDDVNGARKLSLDVTRVCLDYAESIGRVPSISELCLVAHVSERRLRYAFNQEFDMSPAQFFRAWGLDMARRRLMAHHRSATTVSRVAANLGFEHLGRFARYYRKAYGETPKSTLLARPPAKNA